MIIATFGMNIQNMMKQKRQYLHQLQPNKELISPSMLPMHPAMKQLIPKPKM